MTIRIGYCLALALAVALAAGCGGGGGKKLVSPSPTPPGDSTTRTITGSVVSSAGSVNLPGVTVRLGDTSIIATTDVNGKFSFTVDRLSDLPAFLQIDPSGAGEAYASGMTVSYRSQTYLTTHVDIPVDVLNGVISDLGVIRVYDMSGDSAPPPPFTSKDTILIGRVVSRKTGVGINNVTVEFGRLRTITARTGAAGYFAINLGFEASVSSVYPSLDETFSIDSSTAGAAYPTTLSVRYREVTSLQSAISVPTSVLTGSTTDLGTLSIVDDGSGDGGGEEPPPPPGDDDDGDGPPPPPI